MLYAFSTGRHYQGGDFHAICLGFYLFPCFAERCFTVFEDNVGKAPGTKNFVHVEFKAHRPTTRLFA